MCGSLLYAREDQIGKTIPCPDCHSENEVKTPKPQDLKRPYDGPTLDDAEDFALSETFERPKFEALELPPREEPEDDDGFSIKPLPVTPTQAVSSSASDSKPRADTGMVELFSSHGGALPPTNAPATRPPPPRTPPPSSPVASSATTTPQPFSTEQLGNQFKAGVAALFPPASEPASPPGKPRIRKHADSYGDELWSGATDSSRPAFERSPFLVGIVEFLFYPGTMPRWLALVALASIPTAVLQMTSGAVESTGTLFSGSALGLLFLASIVGVPWLAIFGAHAMSIVSDTARGCDAIEHWPLGGFVPRGNPLFLPIAFFAGMLPGLLVFAIYYLTRESPTIRGPIILLVSAMLFMPLVWLPMLLEKSPLAPFQSQTFWQSFRFSGDGWFTFYFAALILALVASGGMAMWGLSAPILAPLSAVLLVTPLLLYLRLLGRMLWYIDPDMAPPPPPPKAAPPPLPDTVDPTQIRR